MTKYLIQYSQMYFYLIVPTAICQIPFTPLNGVQERQLLVSQPAVIEEIPRLSEGITIYIEGSD
jgi:hypothetical protein